MGVNAGVDDIIKATASEYNADAIAAAKKASLIHLCIVVGIVLLSILAIYVLAKVLVENGYDNFLTSFIVDICETVFQGLL